MMVSAATSGPPAGLRLTPYAAAVQLRGTCDLSTWTDRYTEQMLHVWVVPYPVARFPMI